MTAKSSRAPARGACNSPDDGAGGLAELRVVKLRGKLVGGVAPDEVTERNAVRVSIRLIEPLSCNRPSNVSRYVAMLRAGERALPILVIRQSIPLPNIRRSASVSRSQARWPKNHHGADYCFRMTDARTPRESSAIRTSAGSLCRPGRHAGGASPWRGTRVREA